MIADRIRKLETEDAPTARMRGETLAARMYPELIPDIERTHWLVRDTVRDPKHYARCIGTIGEPGAVLLARTGNNLWALKRHATILLWYSDLPGAGAALLRDFKRWLHLEEQRSIVVAGLSADWVLHDRAATMIAERNGFIHRGEGTYLYFPRGRKDGHS